MSGRSSVNVVLAAAGTLLLGATVWAADPVRGGLLWDRWWRVNGAPTPTGTHPLYPPGGPQSGSTTFRCKECHGWDYKGADGAYGEPGNSHYTGIAGVFGTTLTTSELVDIIKTTAVPNGHGFGAYGLTDADIDDLVAFIETAMIDTDLYIDGDGEFVGDPDQGRVNYEVIGSCAACHGEEGTAINFGSPADPEWVGTIAVANPWELLHKIRFGNPGTSMPSWVAGGGTDQGAADIGAYAQASLPGVSLCTAVPRTTCAEATRATFLVKRPQSPTRAKLKFRWLRGPAVDAGDFGAPDAETNYALCVYDSELDSPLGAPTIDIRPNAAWSSRGARGWRYRDPRRTFAGMARFRLRAGPSGTAQISASGVGATLPLPDPVAPDRFFEQDPSVTVQLVNENARCWSATFTTSRVNSETSFKAILR